ncbi:type ISP restriction/modification enzyme, partial [Rhodococcus sp. EPR-157]|uniref:type ISP restriction/modification enzyme n=1 Tax=Rhodococcus sp. EPR-157 TaxID=1813677 RepID=UPI0012E7671C
LWLKAPIPEGECRILTNARCLSEGVDVPALDAVMFLNPRNSVVDVVQSVGRVMRKSEGKDYGYIILPVAVPAGVSPSQALSDNQRFKVVWQVLNALRAHDDRFNAMVNSIALNANSPKKTGKGTDRLLGGHIGPMSDGDESISDGSTSTETETPNCDEPADGAMATQMALFSLSEWQEAIVAKIVDKVGTRVYWEQWAGDVADIANAQITRINVLLGGSSPAVAEQFEKFLTGLRDNLNDSISRDDAVSMLSQHLITKPVFDALFAGHDFASHNPVSIVMQSMVDALGDTGLEAEASGLEKFYDSVRVRASEVNSAEGKQQVIAELYERFFRIAFRKQSEALGIVYTPTEIVDFILRAADHVSKESFGRGLTDEGVHILDPFTGTGTFITRLMQSGLILPADLARKYAEELHANEIMLLAYYIAAVNIESTFHALTTAAGEEGKYVPFEGIVLADTFQITEDGDSMDAIMFPQNNSRIEKQLAMPINVIVGNPPYSVGQTSANDLNANIKYPTLDGRIEHTYAERSMGTNKNSLYDSYYRAYRWATDRVGETGIVAFVSNGGWIDGNTASGVRLSFVDEYAQLYVYNLRGNQRTAGELSRMEGGKVFGGGSRSTIAIFVGVKNPAHAGSCEIHYRDIGDYLTREEKLRIIETDRLDTVDWQPIAPNTHGDWTSQRDNEFGTWPVIGSRDNAASETRVFSQFSRGLETARDAWVYNYSRTKLVDSVKRLIENYNAELGPFTAYCTEHGITRPTEGTVSDYLSVTPFAAAGDRIKWSASLKQHLSRRSEISYSDTGVITGAYRPFDREYAYFSATLNHRRGQLTSMFPTPHHRNPGIVLTAPASHFEFTPFITDLLPNLHLLDTGQFFPRWTYEFVDSETNSAELDFGNAADRSNVDEYGYRRIDNITDDILQTYQDALTSTVTKDQIFYFVYAQLHVPSYRKTYAGDLKKMLPHIPTPGSIDRFHQLATAGEQLAHLHTSYESVDPYPLRVDVKPGVDMAHRETWRVQKMKWRSRDDHTAIVYNPKVTITGVPAEAEDYLLGSRSALGWVIDRYQVKTDKASGIVNDPNDWCDELDEPTYIVELIKKVTTVAVETVRIVTELEPEGSAGS